MDKRNYGLLGENELNKSAQKRNFWTKHDRNAIEQKKVIVFGSA